MPDALEMAAQQDAYFASTGKLIGPLTAWCSPSRISTTPSICDDRGMDSLMRTIVAARRNVRQAPARRGAIILGKANLGENGTPNSRSSFGGRSVTLTIRNAVQAPPAAAPDHRRPRI